MSFRTRQKVTLAMSIPISHLEESVQENGEFTKEVVDAYKEMPDPELFRIGNLTAAGVDLQEVNSKVMGCRKVNIDGLNKVIGEIYKENKQEEVA